MRMRNIRKKLISIVCIGIYIINLVSGPQVVEAAEYWPEGPEVSSQAAIVMEESTGTILYEKNMHDQHYPASITKILTALIAIENCPLNDVVTFSKEAVYKTEGSGIARDVGEEMTMEQCLYGMMLESANECAYAIAEHVGGTVDHFVEMMNEKAKELGCTESHFHNPHGLPDPEHVTSAHDMALIAQAAFSNETFRIICGSKTYTIPVTNKHPNAETYLVNHHKMLNPRETAEFLYEYCLGGKTGYTTMANATLVTYAEKDGMTLVCVTMDALGNNNYVDTRTLFDYCFDNFQVCNVAEETAQLETDMNKKNGILNNVSPFAKIDPNAVIVLPKASEFSEVTSKISYDKKDKNTIATLEYTFAKHNVGKVELLASDSKMQGFKFAKGSGIIEEEVDQNTGKIKNVKEINIGIFIKIIIGILIVLVGAVIIIKATGNTNTVRRKMRRNQPKTKIFKDRK